MFQKFATALIGLALCFGLGASASADSIQSQTYPLNREVREYAPVVVFQGYPRYVESMDVNWLGARGSAVMARIYADGQEVWSGLIPAYDPTFRATIRMEVSEIELRVDSGVAVVNWAKVYTRSSGETSRPCRREACRPDFIGSLLEADDLAWTLVQVINELDDRVSPEAIRSHLIPLKVTAAGVFTVAKGNGNLNQGLVFKAVYALEEEFQRQEAYLQGLLESNMTFNEGVSLLTIRERYKALFGVSRYER
ncbi:MAG: hypothetical protein NDJ90_05495 [Oligoflexia bacterium]|nr:hypothetical protein [Oligoflexia bacterium]